MRARWEAKDLQEDAEEMAEEEAWEKATDAVAARACLVHGPEI